MKSKSGASMNSPINAGGIACIAACGRATGGSFVTG
jgi:hypothetical protein